MMNSGSPKDRFKHIIIAATMVSIPLFTQLITREYSWSLAAFCIVLFVLLITMGRQLNSNTEAIKLLHTRVESGLNEMNGHLTSFQKSMQTLLLMVASHTHFDIEIVNRSVISRKEGYARLLAIMKQAKKSIKIISPPKSSDFCSKDREIYFARLEAWVKHRGIKDSSFIFNRIVPIEPEQQFFCLNTQLLKHCQTIHEAFPKSVIMRLAVVVLNNVIRYRI